jgi:tRNA pseudouridine55 synthase
MAVKAIPLHQLPVISKISEEVSDPVIFTDGAVILMDKPAEWSSFDVVRYVRNRVPPKKVGHAGTLDPLATGLLVLCTGKATKTISQIQEGKKTYIAGIRFGASTPSFDAATEPDETADWKHITAGKISDTLTEQFTGTIDQVPPVYSAIKMKGERLYKLARRGEEVHPEPRKVEVISIDILELNLPELELRITCGKGTYIRSLAHDLGLALGSRAFLSSLRRTEIGPFSVNDAFLPEEFDTFSRLK